MSHLPFISTKSYLCRSVLCGLGAVGFVLPSALADQNLSQAIQKEQRLRTEAINTAEERLLLGDEAFKQRDYEQALSHYRAGLNVLPLAPVADERRSALKQRFGTAALASARLKRKTGDYPGAVKLLEEVLAPSMLPANHDALLELERVNDPARSNPALNPAHVANTKKVAELLQLAEGQINLGLFDKAEQTCEDVLRIDPYNRSARRLMEKAGQHVSNYQDSARDQMRAEILNDIAKAWSLTKADDPTLALENEPGEVAEGIAENRALNLEARLRSTKIESFEVTDERLDDVIAFLESAVAKASPGEKPVNIFLEIGDPSSEIAQKVLNQRITIKVFEMPASQILNYICRKTGTEVRYDPFAVRILPSGSDSSALQTRQFKVPADFLSTAAEEETDDIFGEEDQGAGLRSRQSAEQFFKESGVSFPNGASVQHNSFNNTLYVRNTEGNIRLVEAIVESLKRSTPVQVVFTTTFIEVNQSDLEELGFDWLLDDFSTSGSGNLLLNGGTPPSDISVGADLPPSFGSGAANPGNSLTSGLRSGAGMFDIDPLEDRLASDVGTPDSSARAPGVLAFRGAFSDADFMTVIRGLSQKTGADVLLRPSLIARPGEVASLFSGQEFIYPTEYEPPQLPNQIGQQGSVFPVTPATPAAFETRELGITLEIEPTVGEDNRIIELRVAPEFSDFIGFINYGSPITADATDALGNTNSLTITENIILQPVFRSSRLNTSIAVTDGQTMVIGGLKREERQIVEDSVPILSDIPWVGRFFKSEGIRRQQRCILVFVKARLIDPGGAPINDPQ